MGTAYLQVGVSMVAGEDVLFDAFSNKFIRLKEGESLEI